MSYVYNMYIIRNGELQLQFGYIAVIVEME